MVNFNLPGSPSGEGGLLVDPSLARALRFLSLLMVLPGIALAIPYTFKFPFAFRFPGMFMSIFSGLVALYCLPKKKRSKVLVTLLDLVVGILLALFAALQMANLNVWVKDRSYRYRYQVTNSYKNAVIITCFWCMPIMIQIFIHLFFFLVHAKTLFTRLRSISLTTCPHCHRSTNAVFAADSPTGSPHPRDPTRYSILGQTEEAYRDSFDDDAQARRTSFTDTPRVSQEAKTEARNENAAAMA